MTEALVRIILQKFGRKVHYGMLIAVGMITVISLLINFTWIHDAYKDSIPAAILIAIPWLYVCLYLQLGMLYQLSRFFRKTEKYFPITEQTK